ncbi:MAG: RNA-guided endonuclease TnpB family protein [Pseudanabaenaceae cyanobacterium SKYGB_i_bin29]|nr:transposase [Pseudanabaenaceae cyanobacterium SKYG29]MDW8422056.1 RNA-guided endonuclease TnpB family protein [Pseudanabaenaceae cyanobacterium SKYGB_i_bin29]
MAHRAYTYRFYPTPEQEVLLRKTIGCARLVYNRALAVRKEAWEHRQEQVGYGATSALLTEWKRQEDLQFLNEVSCVPLQQSLRHLQSAFTNFFAGRAKYPVFKKKQHGGSAEYTKSAFRWKNGQLFLAKCNEPLPIVWSRELPQGSEPSTVIITLTPSGRWMVSILVEEEIAPLPPTENKVGIDLGLDSLVTLSNGVKVKPPKRLKAKLRQLRRAQRALSRKQKGSKNRAKARMRVAKIHAQIADARKDFLHKLTTQLVKENQLIAVEDLAVRNMIQNHKLACSISDAGWGELVRQLQYKCEWYGRQLVKIDRWFPSSKQCSNCGHIAETMPLHIREWECPMCHAHHDRDVNAARNILAAGLAVAVCGATVRPARAGAMKQKSKS